MPPRLNLFTARSLLFRSAQCYSASPQLSSASGDCILQQGRSAISSSTRQRPRSIASLNPAKQQRLGGAAVVQCRANSTSSKTNGDTTTLGEANEGEGGAEESRSQAQDTLPDVSSEAAETARIMSGKSCSVDGGVGGPELEQGTPVVDILRRDKDALNNLPKVLRDQIASPGGDAPRGTRSFSTSSRTMQMDMPQDWNPALMNMTATDMAHIIAGGEQALENTTRKRIPKGLKFDLPALPLQRSDMMKKRYDPLVDHFTKLIMWDGKLSLAQKHMDMVLDMMRTAPQLHLDSRLLPNPGPTKLSLDPIALLTLVVDSIAPLMKIRQQKGAAGGGRALPIPIPLSIRQRRRTAINWIIDSSEKRRDHDLPKRLFNEIMAVAEGRSSLWDKRAQVHKLATAARVNVMWTPMRAGMNKKRI